jgi:Helix-turn-helix of DDE superfamily endonuclease
MSFSNKDLKNDRQWKAATGVSEKDFIELSNAFEKAYEMKQGISLEQASANLGQPFALPSYKDCLFFVLFQLKNGLTQDCLGLVFGMDGSSAWRNFQKYLSVLELALQQEHALPKRHFQSVEEFVKYLHQEKEITVDVTAYGVQRPADKQKQQQDYSGKKKTYP